MNVAFWNVNKNEAIDIYLEQLVLENDIDVLILAEYSGNIEDFANRFDVKRSFTQLQTLGCDKIKGIISTRYKQEQLATESRYCLLRIKTSYFDLLFGMIHGESKFHSEDDDRTATFIRFYNDIENNETKLNIGNSIIVGDLNSNPFEKNVIGASTLHAIPYREEVFKPTRVVSGKTYKKFYNPMWKFLGKRTPPYGTYYYNGSNIVNYYWNMFDQVIIRPALLTAFDENDLKIVTYIGDKSLLDEHSKPNKDFSDHLPLIFKIQEDKIK